MTVILNCMSSLKTLPNDANVEAFIDSVPDETKRNDSHKVLEMFTRLTGEKPKMWGTSIVGYGMYHYKSERSSQEGDWPLIGFSPRKQNLTLYIMPGFAGHEDLLGKLGKHKTSVGCLYIKRLSDVDQGILEELISQTFTAMKAKYN